MAAQQNNLWDLCGLGELNLVRDLLLAGADPNTRGGIYNRTCLMWTILNNHEEVVDLLLAQPGIEVNGSFALHVACSKGNVAILSKLLAVPGILVNKRDSDGRTPIMQAICDGRTDAVRVMAAVDEVNLDVDLRDNDGMSMEESAWPGNATEIVAIVREARQRREERNRLVMEQKNKVSKVLLDGISDEESSLHKLRAPRYLVNVVMPIVWEYLTWDWQGYGENQA